MKHGAILVLRSTPIICAPVVVPVVVIDVNGMVRQCKSEEIDVGTRMSEPEVKIKSNFGWGITDRQMILFMPNYEHSELTEYALKRITTVMENKDYAIIIGNDGIDKDWSYIRDIEGLDNVYYFTLFHDGPKPRNGAFIRNYMLKRCNSEFFFQKDGEVILEGDFLYHAANKICKDGYLWRAGNIAVLNETDSRQYREQDSLDDLEPVISKRVEPVVPLSARDLKQHLIDMNGQINFTSFFHYAYCTKTRWLQDINGYDESYAYYGYEDSDMFLRLTALKGKFKPDYACWAIHQWHPSAVNKDMLAVMSSIFADKDPYDIVRNEDGWGEGI